MAEEQRTERTHLLDNRLQPAQAQFVVSHALAVGVPEGGDHPHRAGVARGLDHHLSVTGVRWIEGTAIDCEFVHGKVSFFMKVYVMYLLVKEISLAHLFIG